VIWDVEGREYLDFNSGQLCAVLGHAHPEIAAAIGQAARTLVHASSTYYNIYEIALSERLAATLPASLSKSFFALSGSDASEGAINIAKKLTGRYEVASPHLAFHGLSDTPRAISFAGWHKGIAPGAPGNYAAFAPYCLRCPIKLSYPSCGIACVDAGLEILNAETTGPLAAFMTEPIFSAGGVIEPPPGWLARMATVCREQGALLILDESQTGLAKTGTMWAFETEGVVPDIVTISKHFGGGIAISAVVTSAEIEAEVIDRGFQYAHSHSADPLGCAAAFATIEVIERENLIERAIQLGGYWRAHLESLARTHGCIADVRGRGLLQAVEFQHPDGSPGYSVGPQVRDACLRDGLLFSMRRNGSVLRFTPPFTTSEEQMDRAAEILNQALAAVVIG
jgi:2,2-dialkylglycine decarboxylase (pyruvate)